MTIDEALKLIQADINDEAIDWDSPLGRAYKLSFEALKRHQLGRNVPVINWHTLLPGETKE